MGYIRFLLALSVVLSHGGPLPIFGQMVGGQVAVQGFFMLSGFYMALVLHQPRYAKAAPFYWNRFSRIFSGYWVVLIFAGILAMIAGAPFWGGLLSAPLPVIQKMLVALSNIFLIGNDWILFIPSEPPLQYFAAIAPAWSLPVELCFYLIAPFAVRSMPRMLALLAASMAIRVTTYSIFGETGPWVYRFMLSELSFFMIGAMSYRLLPFARRLSKAVGIAALGLVVALIAGYEAMASSIYILAALAVLTPLVFVSASEHATRLDRELGEISYSLYLCHVPIMAAFPYFAARSASICELIVLSILAAFPLHYLGSRLDAFIRSQRVLPAPSLPIANQTP